jgi:hypothetical protein
MNLAALSGVVWLIVNEPGEDEARAQTVVARRLIFLQEDVTSVFQLQEGVVFEVGSRAVR